MSCIICDCCWLLKIVALKCQWGWARIKILVWWHTVEVPPILSGADLLLTYGRPTIWKPDREGGGYLDACSWWTNADYGLGLSGNLRCPESPQPAHGWLRKRNTIRGLTKYQTYSMPLTLPHQIVPAPLHHVNRVTSTSPKQVYGMIAKETHWLPYREDGTVASPATVPSKTYVIIYGSLSRVARFPKPKYGRFLDPGNGAHGPRTLFLLLFLFYFLGFLLLSHFPVPKSPSFLNRS